MENNTLQKEIYVTALYVRISYVIPIFIYSFIAVLAYAVFRDILIVKAGVVLLWLIGMYFMLRGVFNPARVVITSDGTLIQEINRHKTVQISLLNLAQINAKVRGAGVNAWLVLTLIDRQGGKVIIVPRNYAKSSELLGSINSGGQYSQAEYTGVTTWTKIAKVSSGGTSA